uniref:Uncharacterized protein n=1 Tax=Cacopsylla melanoneura TaxID=428564 RepID=A0A8D8Z9H8_9HEMI
MSTTMVGTPMKTRNRVNQLPFSADITHEPVLVLAIQLENQVKKCLESLESQDINNLVPIIVESLVSLDSSMTLAQERLDRLEALTGKMSVKSDQIKHLKQELSNERQGHQQTIDESDSQYEELSKQKKSAEQEQMKLRQKIQEDKQSIQDMTSKIVDMTTETRRVNAANDDLRNEIQILKSRVTCLNIQLLESAKASPDSPVYEGIQDTSSAVNISGTACKTIHIVGDSNVRGLGSIVRQFVSGNTEVYTSCVPGGGLCEIKIESFIRKPVPGDLIVVHAGTNDICVTKWDSIKRALQQLFTTFHQCQFLVMTVPPRYDCVHLNKHINKFNTLVKYVTQDYDYVRVVQTRRAVTPRYMKQDGVHYNAEGKERIARKIASLHKTTRWVEPPHVLGRDSDSSHSVPHHPLPEIAPGTSDPSSSAVEVNLLEELNNTNLF